MGHNSRAADVMRGTARSPAWAFAIVSTCLSSAACADELFAADPPRLFGYTLGTSTGDARPSPTQQKLPAEFAPFTEVELRWSQPSGTLFAISGSASTRNHRACVERLNALRAQFDATLAIPLRDESFEAFDGDAYLGYYGSREAITWRASCEGRDLSLSATDSARENGCDPRERPARPEHVVPTEWTERFPALETSPTPESRGVWQRIGDRAEAAYDMLLSKSQCLEGAMAITAVVAADGSVQAVAISTSGFPDGTMEQRVNEIVRATAFPASSTMTWRLTSASLQFALRH